MEKETQELIETWANQETKTITIGNNEHDIIEIIGGLKSGKNRSIFKLIVNHDGVTADMDYQITPSNEKFSNIFTSVVLNGRNIDLTYDVGMVNNLIKINAIINKYKI